MVHAVVLLCAVWATGGLTGTPDQRRRPTPALVALVVVAVPSLLQLTVLPGLLGALERDRDEIAAGQVWRLVTALLVQDGGVLGTVSNLVFLAAVGLTATRVWRGRQWHVVALAGSLAAVTVPGGTRTARPEVDHGVARADGLHHQPPQLTAQPRQGDEF